MATRTVRIFQDRIFDLADDPNDPASEILEQLAYDIREAALDEIEKIFKHDLGVHREDLLTVETGKDTKGIFFRVVLDSEQRWGRYLARKQMREQGWFRNAVIKVVGLANVRHLA